MVVIVSKFTERSLRLYNKKKNLSKTPTYLEDLRQYPAIRWTLR